MPEISYDGFLSSDMGDHIKQIRKFHAAWFDYLTELNQFGEKFLTETGTTTEYGKIASKQLIALLLTARSLSNLQGAILMAERGMVVESRILVRTICENVFFISALYEKGDEFANKMLAAQHLYSDKFGEQLLKKKYLDEQKTAELSAYLKAHKDSPKAYLQVDEVAKIGEQPDLYTFYSLISNDAAHPSMGSLNRYLDDQNDGNVHINTLPDIAVEETLVFMAMGTCGVIGYAIEILDAKEFRDAFEPYKNKYAELEIHIKPENEYISPILTGFKVGKL